MGRASPSHDAARGRPAPAPRGRPPGPGRPRRRIGPDGDGEPVPAPGPPHHCARAARGRRRARHPGRPRRPPPPGSARGQGRRRVDEPRQSPGRRLGAGRPLHRLHGGRDPGPRARRRQDAHPHRPGRPRVPGDAHSLRRGHRRAGRPRPDGHGRAVLVGGGRARGPQPPRSRLDDPGRPGGLRTGPLERTHLAQAAGRRRPGQGHGRHDTAEPAARRRPTRGAGADVCRVGPSARPARRARARRRTCAALPAGRRRGRGRGRRGRPRARWRGMSADLWGEARFGVTGRGSDNEQYVRPVGTADEGAYAVAITPSTTSHVAGWEHTRLRVAVCGEGEYADHDSNDEETLVVPLAGSFRVEVTEADGTTYDVTLVGRGSVFDGPTDALYAGRGSRLRVSLVGPDPGPGRVALCGAPATKQAKPVPCRHLPASEVPVELRGAGRASREVRNLGLPDVLDADSLLVCEVVTPAGKWSSWPPHKHDHERPQEETALEEIYYVETRSTDPRGTNPVGYLRVYGTVERPLDVVAEVGTGDVVLVPHGWHGPAIASPDVDLYYLNVMAGPGPERAWRICDDPAHAWVRETWADEDVDSRLPVGGPR